MSHSRHNRRSVGQSQRSRALAPSGTKKALPQIYLKGGQKILPEIYLTDHDTHKGFMFKWIVSTMFAGVVGVGAIGTVLYASTSASKDGTAGSLVSKLRMMGESAMKPFKPRLIDRTSGPRAASNKGDRLIVTSKGLSTSLIIHDSFAKKRDNRRYMTIKPYARLINTLATARPDDTSAIPAFDPFKLYANTGPVSARKLAGASNAPAHNTSTSSRPLPLSIMAGDDDYQISDSAAAALVAIAAEDYLGQPHPPMDDNGAARTSGMGADTGMAALAREAHTTIIVRQAAAPVTEPETIEQHSKTVRQGDTINSMLRTAGAESWQAAQIITAMNKVYPARAIKVGQILRYVAVPKPGDAGKTEPAEIALYKGKQHLVTVARNEAGEYAASKKPGKMKYHGRKSSYPRRATLYQSFYHSGLLQHLPPATIMKLLRIHAFDTDFKRRTQPGDSFEAFFDMREDKGKYENIPNELLYTSITINGKKRAFYRYRTPDGKIDYYDRRGNSAKKFLMRKPVRSNRIRLASGFGWRMHPILHTRRMHTGTDWAGPSGTPILAAGDGTVEKAGRKGGYGNHIRIRHANGYKTTYSHMRRFAKNIKAGVRVRQGQVIGYIGTTGRSTGPHLHFEVLVNNKFVNAMTIPVPRGLELKGHLLTLFNKERDRINELMSRDPVTTKVASAK